MHETHVIERYQVVGRRNENDLCLTGMKCAITRLHARLRVACDWTLESAELCSIWTLMARARFGQSCLRWGRYIFENFTERIESSDKTCLFSSLYVRSLETVDVYFKANRIPQWTKVQGKGLTAGPWSFELTLNRVSECARGSTGVKVVCWLWRNRRPRLHLEQ